MPTRQRQAARGPDRRRDVLDERAGVEDVRRAEGVEPEQVEVRRGDRACRADATRSAASIPNLPAPSSPTRRTRSSRACSETAARSRTGWTRPAVAAIASSRASSPGDSTVTARTPAATAARELVVALARAGHHDPVRRRSRPGSDGRELAAGRDVGPEPEPAEVRDDRERRVRLDRVGELDARPAGRPAAPSTWRSMTSRS